MSEIVRPSGVRIRVDDDVVVHDNPEQAPEASARRRRSRRSMTTAGATTRADAQPSDETAALIAALEQDDMTLVDAIDLEPSATTPRRRRSGGELAPSSVALDVPVGEGEEAVLLVEEDGVYRWLYGEALAAATAADGDDAAAGGPRRRRRGEAAPVRTKHFAIELTLDDGESPDAGARLRRTRRGLFGRTILGKAIVFVFRFAARKAVGAIVRRKERHIEPGLVALTTKGGTRFPRFDFATHAGALPTDRPLKVLLFVHGTFSSTLGSYGWLDMTPAGHAFLEAAHREYDLVFGYDHRTLSETPRENADQIHEALAAIPSTGGAPRIDAIGYSRGGLVLRTLVEEVIPEHAQDVPLEVGRCVFVASTHAGTALASRKNVHRLVDTYTNLAVGTCRGVALIPGATPWAMLASTILSGLGEIVKDLAEWALEDGGIPGLAAMEPDGQVVQRLNERLAQDGTVRDYHVIQSTFDVDLAAMSAMPGAIDGFVAKLKDRVTDRLMQEANDLVVDVESMTAIGGDPRKFVKAVHDFGKNASVHHTNYFVQAATVAQLGTWLGLPAATVASGGARRRSRSRGAATAEPTAAGMATALVFADADEPIAALLDRLHAAPETEYAIVVRNGGMHYAFTPDEVVAAAMTTLVGQRRTDASVHETLDLHEWGVTPRAAGEAPGTTDRAHPASASSARRVVLDEHGARVVGVLPSREDAVDPARTLYPDAARAERQEELDLLVRPLPMSPPPASIGEGWAGAEPPMAALPPSAMLPDTDDDSGSGGGRRRRGSRGGSGGGSGGSSSGSSSGSSGSSGGTAVKAKPTPVNTYTPHAGGTTVALHFQAAYDAAWHAGEDAAVEVTLSREQLIELTRDIAVEGEAVQADAAIPLTVHLLVRENAVVQGESSVEVEVPSPGTPTTIPFTVRPTAAGRVALSVEIWQNRTRLGGLQFATKASPAMKKPAKAKRIPGATLLAKGSASPVATRLPVDVLRVSEDPSLPAAGAAIRYDVSYEGVTADPRVRGHGFSEQLRKERREFVDAIYARIQDRWEEHKADAEAFARDLRATGLELWNAIVPRRVQELLWERRDRLTSLQVLSTEAYVPWELVFLNEPGARRAHAEGRFLGELGLTRWIYGAEGTGFAPETLKWGRMTVVQPDYARAGDRLPAAKAEADALVKAYKATRADATMKAVLDLVADGTSWDVLHYCGHGEADAGTIEEASLLLQTTIVDGEEKHDRVYASTVMAEGHLRADGDVTSPGHIVVLNACQVGRSGESLVGLGGFAQAFVASGAGLFVAPLWSVGDELASTFCRTFYERLVAGDTVAEATRAARTAARDAGDATWISYAVYGEPTARLVT